MAHLINRIMVWFKWTPSTLKLIFWSVNSSFDLGDTSVYIFFGSTSVDLFSWLLGNTFSLWLQVEFMPKFSVRGVWQRWRESYPSGVSKSNDAITVFTGVRFYDIWCFRKYFFQLSSYVSCQISRGVSWFDTSGLSGSNSVHTSAARVRYYESWWTGCLFIRCKAAEANGMFHVYLVTTCIYSLCLA
jgi:hypothetical protein